MTAPASLFVLAVVLLVAGWCCVLAIHHAPEAEPEPSEWDARDGVGRCAMAHCQALGTIERISVAEVGAETVAVCPGCSDAGEVKGWWAS